MIIKYWVYRKSLVSDAWHFDDDFDNEDNAIKYIEENGKASSWKLWKIDKIYKVVT